VGLRKGVTHHLTLPDLVLRRQGKNLTRDSPLHALPHSGEPSGPCNRGPERLSRFALGTICPSLWAVPMIDPG